MTPHGGATFNPSANMEGQPAGGAGYVSRVHAVGGGCLGETSADSVQACTHGGGTSCAPSSTRQLSPHRRIQRLKVKHLSGCLNTRCGAFTGWTQSVINPAEHEAASHGGGGPVSPQTDRTRSTAVRGGRHLHCCKILSALCHAVTAAKPSTSRGNCEATGRRHAAWGNSFCRVWSQGLATENKVWVLHKQRWLPCRHFLQLYKYDSCDSSDVYLAHTPSANTERDAATEGSSDVLMPFGKRLKTHKDKQ